MCQNYPYHNFTIKKTEQTIETVLSQHQEHIPEPEPNHNKFTGYIKHDKEGYVTSYNQLKPLRESLELMNSWLPVMTTMSAAAMTRHDLLVERKRLLEEKQDLQADIARELELRRALQNENQNLRRNLD